MRAALRSIGDGVFAATDYLEDRNGDVWVGTDRGVTHLHQGQLVHDAITDGLRNEKIWALHEDADGGLWLGTRTDGLYRYRDGKLTHYTTANGLASNSISFTRCAPMRAASRA